MFDQLKELYALLDRRQRSRLARLQLLVLCMSFAEVFGVMSIGPFMGMVSDFTLIQSNPVLRSLYEQSGLSDPEYFLFWFGACVLLALFLASVISIFTSWKLSFYAHRTGSELATRLYTYYMQREWLFHAAGNSAQLTNRIAQECGRVTGSVIRPLLQLISSLVLAFVMATAVFIYDPVIASIGILTFVTAYILLYFTIRVILAKYGQRITDSQSLRFKLMNEGFGGIKDVLLLGRQLYFDKRFEKASDAYADAFAATQVLAQVPRYAMEFVAFGLVITLVLLVLHVGDGEAPNILPSLSVFALAGFKLLPAFQQVYACISSIRVNLAAFNSVKEELRESQFCRPPDMSLGIGKHRGMSLVEEIRFENIRFSYTMKRLVLDDLTFSIKANKVVGIVGASGCGKSTTIDILLGLISPDRGQLLVDGEPIRKSNLREWQNTLGFVSQSIFLADSSIRENIAFGIEPDQINEDQVKAAARKAHLEELISSLPEGIDTRVGERGIQLSGGQRQRIGIARALYNDAKILIFDEATSALDGITEKIIMDSIHDFGGHKTIVMIAHRLATVKKCDVIYLMERGKIVDSGAYDDLLQRNKLFQKMASHA